MSARPPKGVRYTGRPATLNDLDTLAHHRVAMFAEMAIPIDADGVANAFRRWAAEMVPAGTYRGWLVEAPSGEIVAGGGITILPWPPGPQQVGGRAAFVYNVYTEPGHRRPGLARLIMETIHGWCREQGIASVALNASEEARPLYESMGYHVMAAPMMVCGLEV